MDCHFIYFWVLICNIMIFQQNFLRVGISLFAQPFCSCGMMRVYWIVQAVNVVFAFIQPMFKIQAPNLIIIFEMTMLGAILATVVTLLVTAGLVRRMPALYDPEVSDGKILVGVANPAEASLPDLERALRAGGAAQLRRS